jgi:hypothetical protein
VVGGRHQGLHNYMITLKPSASELPDMVRALTDLADSPYHVGTTMDHGPIALVIPDYLYARYRRYQDLGFESSSPVEPKKRRK